jgi:hypothetical protein
MTVKRLVITLYTLPLMVFLATTIFATFADMLGNCAYDDGTIQTCALWGSDYAWLYDRAHVIGFMSNWSFLVVWILLGGCTLYVMDWLKKRNA